MKKIGIFIVLCILVILCTYSIMLYLRFSAIEIERSTEDEKCAIYQSLLQIIVDENHLGKILVNDMTDMKANVMTILKVENKSRNNILFTIDKILPKKINNIIINKIMNVEDDLPTLLPETLNSFKVANEKSQKLNLACCNIKYKLTTEISPEVWYAIMHERARHNYVIISNVGFNYTKEQALVHVSFKYSGEIFLFVKDKGKWNLKCTKETWRE